MLKPQIKIFTGIVNLVLFHKEINDFLELDHIEFISMTQSTYESQYESNMAMISIIYKNNA